MTATMTATVTPTATATLTSTPLPTATGTPTLAVSATPVVYNGVMTGNVWTHQGPDPASKRNPVVAMVNTK